MKTTSLIVAALLVAGAAAAATVEWSFPTDLSAGYYLKADGKGGCVVWGIKTNGACRVIWLDRKGEVIYDQTLPQLIYGLSIGTRGLFYTYVSPPVYPGVFVDKNGTETPVTSPTEHTVTAFAAIIVSEVMDKKGFFVFRLPTAPPQVVTIVRYSYK
ncbi:hypothetical protein GX586_09375 [bacterium]|nr:hypothetical protein [bacterium]